MNKNDKRELDRRKAYLDETEDFEDRNHKKRHRKKRRVALSKARRRTSGKSSRSRSHRSKKVPVIILIFLVILLFGVLAYRWFSDGYDDAVPVTSIRSLMGTEDESLNRYAGIIKSQEEWTVKRDTSRDIKKVFVKEGDEVQTGTKLFEYDEASMNDEVTQAEIDLQQYDIDIKELQTQIKELEEERKTAASSDKLSYTLQIQLTQNDIKKKEYEKEQQQKSVDELKSNKGSTAVESKIDGIVTKINSYEPNSTSMGDDDDDDETSGSGGSEAFITVTRIGNYQVKCTINEQNYSDIAEGDAMVVYSRTDSSKTWRGTISSIVTEKEDDSDSDEADDSFPDSIRSRQDSESPGSEMTSSSNYSFYIALDSSEDLLLGQHVYVTKYQEQADRPQGIWLDESYICDVNGSPYVWSDVDGKLAKTEVVLGQYNAQTYQYEITAGVTLDDMIAYPDDTYVSGMRTENASDSDEEDTEETEDADEYEEQDED